MKEITYNFKHYNMYGNKYCNIKLNNNIQIISFKNNFTKEEICSFGLFPCLDNLIEILIFKNLFCTIKFNIINNQNKKIRFYNGIKYIIIENDEYKGYISNYNKLRISIEDINNNTIIEYKTIKIFFDVKLFLNEGERKYIIKNIKETNYNYSIVNNSIIDITSLSFKNWEQKNQVGKYIVGKIIIKNTGYNTIYNPKITINKINFSNIDNIINHFTDKNNSVLENIILLFYAVNYNLEHTNFNININNSNISNIILNNFITQLNIYGFGICSSISECFCHLINRYFKINNIYNSECFIVYINNCHYVNEIKYENNYYYFDPDCGLFLIDNKLNVLSLKDCIEDSVYFLQEQNIDNNSKNFRSNSNMDMNKYKNLILKNKYNIKKKKLIDFNEFKMIIRPNECYIYNDNSYDDEIYKYNIKVNNLLSKKIPILSINYNPIFNNDFFNLDGIKYNNIIIEKKQLMKNKSNSNAYLQICTKTNHLILNIEILIETQNKEELKIQISKNEIDWIDINNYTNSYINLKNLDNNLNILDNVLFFYNNNFYEYYIRIIIDNYSIKNIILKTICICNISSSIFLKKGENIINYCDDNSTRNIEITHEWIESYEPQNFLNNKINLEYPSNLSIIKNDNILFKWNRINNCDEYQFILSKFKDFKYPFRRNCNIFTKQNEYFMKNNCFIENITYYWKVRPIINMIYDNFSEIYEFKFIK